MLISLYLFLSVAVADQFRNKECREIAFVTTIRTSEYFEDTLSSRGGVISYRVFRENLLAHNDLIAAVVVDATVSRQNMIYLLSDLRSYEVRFVLFPAEEGHMDLTPNYHYALRAFRSMREKSAACHVMYISPHSIFFKDPTSLIMESIALQPGPPKDILCMRHVYRIDRADTDDFLTASGSTDEVIRIVQLNRSRGHYNVFCSPDMVLFANLSLLPQLMDITDSLVSSYYFYRRYNLQVMGTALESAMGRHDYESILLQTALCTMYHSSSLHGNIGFLPSYAGTDLSAMSSQENADYDLFILISPPLLGNDNRVLLTFGGGQCTIDVSAWNYLSTSLNTEKYSKLAGMAVKYFETTQYACELFANSVSAVPFGDFLEFGSKTVSAVALPWHYGYSISAATGGGDNDTDIAAFAVGLEEVSAMSGPRSFMLLHYHSSPSSIAVAEMNINQTTQTAQKWLNEVISYFEGIPHTELHLVQRRLPCAIWVDSASTNENNHENTDFSVCEFLLSLYESRLYRLGLIPVNQLCQTHPNDFLVIGPHCPHRDFSRIQLLIPAHIALYIPSAHHNTDRIDSLKTKSDGYTILNSSSGVDISPTIGVMVADHPGHEFKVIEDPIPPHLVDMLVGRLLHKSIVQKDIGANSYFIKFDDSKPRSLIEAYIIEHLAPLVVGTQEEARKNGFIGAEWWTQQRTEDDPKEYHMDTAITWCRDNGWPNDLLTACFFYPAVGSVVYLTDEGGPTAVFNQTPGHLGMDPLLPTEVALVFPRKNRLMLFNGARYHGVMRKKPCVKSRNQMNSNDETCLPRVTLLVNYWRDKTAGESYTLTIPQEIEYLRHYNLVKNIKTAPLNIKHKLVRERWLNVNDLTFQRAFSSDFMSWKNQVVPSVVMEAIAASHKGFRYNDGVNLFQHNYTTLNEIADAEAVSYSSSKNVVDPAPSLLLKLEPSEAVLQHAQSTGKHFHHWPTWNIDEYGNLQMYSVDVSPDEMIAWRRSMPGYTEQG